MTRYYKETMTVLKDCLLLREKPILLGIMLWVLLPLTVAVVIGWTVADLVIIVTGGDR